MRISLKTFGSLLKTFEQEGSGWSFMYIKCIDFKIYEYDVIAGGGYIDFPKKIKNRRACRNVNNNVEMCFKWSIRSALHHNDIRSDHHDRVTNYKQYANEGKREGLKYPVDFTNKSMMKKCEDNNKLLITVLGLDEDDIVLVYRSPRYARRDEQYDYQEYKPIILLLVINVDGDCHDIWVKNLSALLSSRDKSENKVGRKSEYCMNSLTKFPSEEKVKKHEVVCVLQGKVTFPKKDKPMTFKNRQNKW